MRYRVYFERVHIYEEENSYGRYSREEGNTLAFWCALGLFIIWPFYEIQYIARHLVVNRMTKVSEEQRLLEEDLIVQQGIRILEERGKRNG